MVDQIQKMYDELYKSKYAGLEKAKNEDLANIDKQERDNANTFYDQRNQNASEYARNVQSVRDYMAKNNLLQSGESMDALLRTSTDYNNGMGTIRTNESKFKNDIASQRNLINKGFNSDVTSMKGDIDSQRMKDIMAYQQQQEALAAQSAARSYSSGGSSGGSSSSATTYSAPAKSAALLEVDNALANGQWSSVYNMMNEPTVNAYLTDKYGSGFMKEVEKKYLASGGTTFNNSFNEKRYARQSTML